MKHQVKVQGVPSNDSLVDDGAGQASVVTDTIDRFDETGIVLSSGRRRRARGRQSAALVPPVLERAGSRQGEGAGEQGAWRHVGEGEMEGMVEDLAG